MAKEWSRRLRDARESLGLSRSELAARASLSGETIRAYETGKRNATAPTLRAIIDALGLEQVERNQVLTAAGFAPEGPPLAPEVTAGYVFTVEEAALQIEEYAWPSMVINESMEIVAANQVAQRLWSIDLFREFPNPVDRNLLTVASDPRFGGKVVNWDEAVGTAIAVLKGHHRGAETEPEGTSAYFAEVIQRFSAGDPEFVGRFVRLWQDVQPRMPKVRWSYPLVWEEPEVGTLRFEIIVSSASEPDALAFNDWIPLDAATWAALSDLGRNG